MRRGFDGLARQVQHVLGQDPFSGHLFVFRGRRGDLVKVLFWDGQGLCLFAKRLERGRFVWPQAKDGVVTLTPAAVVDASGGDRLAHARAHLAAGDGGLNCEFALHRRGRVCHDLRRDRSLRPCPADVRALIEAQAATIARQDAELVAHRDAIETMRLQLERLRRMQFGRSSEKIAAEIAQLTLALEDLETGHRSQGRTCRCRDRQTPRGDAREKDRRDARFPIICRAPRSRTRPPAPARSAAAPCGRSARTSPRCSTTSRRRSGSSAMCGRNSRAGCARASPRRRRRRCRSAAAAPPPSLLAHVLVAKFADHLAALSAERDL